MKQLTLELDFVEYTQIQYDFNFITNELISDSKESDYVTRRYYQLSEIELPLTIPNYNKEEILELRNSEAGSKYYEISDFYTKLKLLNTPLVQADDVFIVESNTPNTNLKKLGEYQVCLNWYFHNWGTIYQYFKDNEVIDQFRPDDYTLWALDLSYDCRTINLDFENKTRIYLSWFYKNKSLNELLADWTSNYK